MKRTVNIGNVKAGEGMPKICVPVMPADSAEMYECAENIMRSPADLVELRADHIASFTDDGNVISVLRALRDSVPGRPVLFTLRTAEEGGRARVTVEEYRHICRLAVDSGLIDALDIEILWGEELTGELTALAEEKGLASVVSMHDFDKTPDEELIVELMTLMESAGGDIVKMAVMPMNDRDVEKVLNASEKLKQILNVPFILISMSSKGMCTRIEAERIGSAITFASVGEASAPGQIDADELDSRLRELHRSVDPDHAVPVLQADERCGSSEKSCIRKENIALMGFMGTGKSSTAEILGRKSGMKVIDIDEMIAEHAGMSIPEIFETQGEDAFRELETEICRKAAAGAGAVISCGGGTVLRTANADVLRANCEMVLLEASPDQVYSRVKDTAAQRPLLTDHMSRGYISWLMKQRNEAYLRAAEHVIDTDGKTPEETAEEIMRILDCSGEILRMPD